MSREKKFYPNKKGRKVSHVWANFTSPESLSEHQDELRLSAGNPAPPRFTDGHMSPVDDETSALDRMRGYLDCLDGLVQDGYPDVRFIEYLCDKVGRPVPPPFFDRVMDENAKLRRRIGDE